MDNFWVPNQKRPITKKYTIASYWYYYLWAGPRASKGFRKKAKKLRTAKSYNIKLKMVKQYSSYKKTLTSVSLLLHQDKKDKKKYFEYNYTLKYMDHIKLNSHIRSTTASQLEHGHAATGIKKILTGVKYIANAKALSKAGRKRLTLNDIHNAGYAWQLKNPDVCI